MVKISNAEKTLYLKFRAVQRRWQKLRFIFDAKSHDYKIISKSQKFHHFLEISPSPTIQMGCSAVYYIGSNSSLVPFFGIFAGLAMMTICGVYDMSAALFLLFKLAWQNYERFKLYKS